MQEGTRISFVASPQLNSAKRSSIQVSKKSFALGAFGIIYRDNSPASGEVLLCRLSYADLWSLPGGGVELDETPVQSVIREVKEETGLDVQVARLVSVDTKTDATVVFCFECEITGGQLTSSEETLEFDYFSPNDFPPESSESHRQRVITAQKQLFGPVFRLQESGKRVGEAD